jgi:hypothetical protein
MVKVYLVPFSTPSTRALVAGAATCTVRPPGDAVTV